MSKYSFVIFLILSIFLLSGCETASYYYQSAVGQIRLSSQREPIAGIVNNSSTSQDLIQRLQLVQKIRSFSDTELKLPVETSYSTYVELQRPFVIWNVYAAPEFSVESHKWCFLVVGCVAYRGYFSEKDAIEKAKQLKAEGLDVHVGGVAAYSTLGWFDDPVLSTFIYREDLALVNLLIHELAHKQVFIKGDTEFNESFATAVANRGLQLWLQKESVSSKNNQSLDQYMSGRKQKLEIIMLVMQYRDKANVVYNDKNMSIAEKRYAKKALLEELNEVYRARKLQEGWDDDYDQFIATMNNAKFSTVANYQRLVPAFERILKLNNYDMEAFYQAVSEVSRLSRKNRQQHLSELLEDNSQTAGKVKALKNIAPKERDNANNL